MKTCRTCFWWERNGDTDDGCCDNTGMLKYNIVDGCDWDNVLTAYHFGCIYHKAHLDCSTDSDEVPETKFHTMPKDKDTFLYDMEKVEKILAANKTPALTAGGHPMFNELLSHLSALYAAKNKDYAGENPLGNFQMCEEFGIPSWKGWKGIMVRLSDKWARIVSLVKNKNVAAVKTESVEDTLIDMAAYSLLMVILLRHDKIAQQTSDMEGE